MVNVKKLYTLIVNLRQMFVSDVSVIRRQSKTGYFYCKGGSICLSEFFFISF